MLEAALVSLAGREVTLQATVVPVKGDDGQIEGFLVVTIEQPASAAMFERGTEP